MTMLAIAWWGTNIKNLYMMLKRSWKGPFGVEVVKSNRRNNSFQLKGCERGESNFSMNHGKNKLIGFFQPNLAQRVWVCKDSFFHNNKTWFALNYFQPRPKGDANYAWKSREVSWTLLFDTTPLTFRERSYGSKSAISLFCCIGTYWPYYRNVLDQDYNKKANLMWCQQ